MLVLSNEKQIQKLKAKFPNLNISRKDENTWEIIEKNILPNDEKEIVIFLRENPQTTMVEKKEIERKEIKMAENINQPKANGYEQAKERISAGIAIISETVKAEIFPKIDELKKFVDGLKLQVSEIEKLNAESRERQIASIQKICDELVSKTNQACTSLTDRITVHFNTIEEQQKKFESSVISSMAEKETELKNFRSFQKRLSDAILDSEKKEQE